jgi:hypothetical protein
MIFKSINISISNKHKGISYILLYFIYRNYEEYMKLFNALETKNKYKQKQKQILTVKHQHMVDQN